MVPPHCETLPLPINWWTTAMNGNWFCFAYSPPKILSSSSSSIFFCKCVMDFFLCPRTMSILTIVRRAIVRRVPSVNFGERVPRWSAENVAAEGDENEELNARRDHGWTVWNPFATFPIYTYSLSDYYLQRKRQWYIRWEKYWTLKAIKKCWNEAFQIDPSRHLETR